MQLNEIQELQALMRRKDWSSVHAFLDAARDRAFSPDDLRSEAYWRISALAGEQRYEEAIELLRKSADLFSCQSLVRHNLARFLSKLGRDREALDELKDAPIEEEMEAFHALAIDAKFFYLYLLAKTGDASVRSGLSAIPDDYRHITLGGKFLTKADIVALLN